MLAFEPKRRNGGCRGFDLSPRNLRFPSSVGGIMLSFHSAHGDPGLQAVEGPHSGYEQVLSKHRPCLLVSALKPSPNILTQHRSNTLLLVFILEANMSIYKPGDTQNDKP